VNKLSANIQSFLAPGSNKARLVELSWTILIKKKKIQSFLSLYAEGLILGVLANLIA
jgi:hypothetical protein